MTICDGYSRNVSEEERKSLELQFGRSTQVYEGLIEHAEFTDASELHRRFTRDLVQILSRDHSTNHRIQTE